MPPNSKDLHDFISNAAEQPDQIEFAQIIAFIDANYQYTPTAFSNGTVQNEAGTNEGSCKILAFAHLNKLSQQQTLALFGTFYRDDVLKNPDGSDHGNIRNFILTGWDGVQFAGTVLA